MQEARINHAALDRLVERLAQSPQVIREAKRRAFETAAPRLKALVRAQIGGSGKVQRWQEAYTGSKGGYAAVRPKAGTYTYSGRKKKLYAVGYVTNAINSGHRTPRNKWGYRSSMKIVEGRQFYQQAQDQAGRVAQEAAQQIVAALTEHLEG